ncbi:MAG: hypothetical protein KDD92_06475 [Caldilineaceae bacterium]|nr:hypothetical protein [Caldilineaceae bacterium]
MSNRSLPSLEANTIPAGSLPCFPDMPGGHFADSLHLDNFRSLKLIFNRLDQPGQVHVYSSECHAGERLRAQIFVPALPQGKMVAPAFAVVAQSLPYSADAGRLPIELPAGFSVVVAPPPAELTAPERDRFTGARYYPGPIIDTKTLISGRCYLVVWSPQNQIGKYVLQIGHRRPWRWSYWSRLPQFWWQIRGWFGMSRAAAYAAAGGIALTGWLCWRALRRKTARPRKNDA